MHNVILHATALSVLVAGLSAINLDVRRHVVNIVAGDAVSELAIIAAPVNQIGRLAVATLHDYEMANPLLMLFALAAVVLFVLMFRS